MGALLVVLATLGATPPPDPRRNVGPYDAVFLAGSVGLSHPLAPDAALLAAGARWSMSGWVRTDVVGETTRVVAALGDPASRACRCLLLVGGRYALSLGAAAPLVAGTQVAPGTWHALAASYDGARASLYLDGVLAASEDTASPAVAPLLALAPAAADDLMGARHFGGALARFAVAGNAADADEARRSAALPPDFALLHFHAVGVGWPWQERAWRGLEAPQSAWTLPQANAPYSTPAATPAAVTPALGTRPEGGWTLDHWRLAAAPTVVDPPERLATSGYADDGWYAAVVPGTVLTTLIARGVYPDPAIGLNNLAIPESLARQDYWYRTEFRTPAGRAGRRLRLTFQGVNYAAEVWLNGHRLGALRGAFRRGSFDLTGLLREDADNALAVRVSPPPHPGIPHEQSVLAGPGENGGNLALDGPTFVASEGWDWIPGIRDRNTGLWQQVVLESSGALTIGDPQVITHLPLPRTDHADVVIRVPVENASDAAIDAEVGAAFDAVRVEKHVRLAPGANLVVLDPAEFPALGLEQPRLWWPNGYGTPELYTLELRVGSGGATSDLRRLRFGIRELSYELSLFDAQGALRRVEVDPAAAALRGERLVDVRHEALKRTANGWAASLTPAGEHSDAVHEVASTSLSPYLVIRVNGVPIAARGGSWGMDDLLKRSSRTRLEPYFRLHRAAHLNIIRNWLGQSTEEVFYELADEYGLLVLNDFWASTQDFQVEPEDPALFLDNARDVLRRYRNHPSIAVWFGRNEGVPQPVLNEGLADLVATEDGTRYYTGSSNAINLQGSGPYDWRPPEQYFTTLARGFSVEVGTPSLATRESLERMIPAPDRWPLGDTYAYHDWHFGGNGDTASFMAALAAGLGAATGFADFERKAQLMDYVSYRAIFEGFQAGLWRVNSGRLLWMTHPAWPSNTWQIYTADYDTPAAYYAVAKACEPLHVQLDLPGFEVAVVNTTRRAEPRLHVTSRLYALDNHLLAAREEQVAAPANAVTTLAPLPVAEALAREGVVLVALTLRAPDGALVSRNVYWQAQDDAAQRRLAALPVVPLRVTAHAQVGATATRVEVALANRSRAPALLAKLTAFDARDHEVLPVAFSDNYATVLAGETLHLTLDCPAAGLACRRLRLRGWNVAPLSIPIDAAAPSRDRSPP